MPEKRLMEKSRTYHASFGGTAAYRREEVRRPSRYKIFLRVRGWTEERNATYPANVLQGRINGRKIK